MSFATRTTTAFITSPFFTRPRGIASFTDTTMTSPTVAYLRFEPPSTLMHMTRRAPELSATSRLVCIWIMMHLILSSRAPCALLLRLLLAPGHGPALELRDRTMFLDPHDVADRIFILLVVGVIVLAAPNGLLEHRVREAALDADHHRLVLLVAHHDALEHPLLPGDGFDARDVAPYLAHASGVLELPARPLEAQVEALLLELHQLVAELI